MPTSYSLAHEMPSALLSALDCRIGTTVIDCGKCSVILASASLAVKSYCIIYATVASRSSVLRKVLVKISNELQIPHSLCNCNVASSSYVTLRVLAKISMKSLIEILTNKGFI